MPEPWRTAYGVLLAGLFEACRHLVDAYTNPAPKETHL